MGLTSPTDALTGLALRSGEPVVALVLARRTGGYPDAQQAAAHSPVEVTHLFQAVSLPIRGVAGDYNDFDPEPDQAAVRFALSMTGARDWEAFKATALDFRTGAPLATHDAHAQLFGGDDPEPKVLGLAIFAETTWSHLVRQAEFAGIVEDDVAVVLDAMRDARSAMAAGDPFNPGWFDLLQLRKGSPYTHSDGREIDLPRFARCLGTSGAFEFAPTFVSFLGGAKGPLRLTGKSDGSEPIDLAETVAGVAQTHAVGIALRYLNRQLVPSFAGGQYRNHREIFETSLEAVGQAAESMLAKVADDPDHAAGDELQGLMDRMETMRAALAQRLAELRADPGDGQIGRASCRERV